MINITNLRTELFSDLDACVAPILNPEEAESDPHIKSREIWVREMAI